jgi:hypothetical protein
MCYNNNKEKNMNKQIRKELRQLKSRKVFLEKNIHWRINELNFFGLLYEEHKLESYKQETQKLINYLDMTWNEYDELTERIKQLQDNLKNWKLVR